MAAAMEGLEGHPTYFWQKFCHFLNIYHLFLIIGAAISAAITFQ